MLLIFFSNAQTFENFYSCVFKFLQIAECLPAWGFWNLYYFAWTEIQHFIKCLNKNFHTEISFRVPSELRQFKTISKTRVPPFCRSSDFEEKFVQLKVLYTTEKLKFLQFITLLVLKSQKFLPFPRACSTFFSFLSESVKNKK